MPERCWCGKDTVLEDHTHDEGLASDFAPRKTRTVCPDHGENWLALPCPYAKDHESEGRQYRRCDTRCFDVERRYAHEHWCSDCVPPDDKRDAALWRKNRLAFEDAWKRASKALAFRDARDAPSCDCGELYRALREVCGILRPGEPCGMEAKSERSGSQG